MRGRNHVAVLTIVSIVMCLVKVEGYEDKSHQGLSQRALQVAMANANGVPPDLVNQFVSSRGDINKLGLRVIEGAGAPGFWTGGEDYTSYSKVGVCRLRPEKHPAPWEVLHHFKSGKLWAAPAYRWFETFYTDAIQFWKDGYREDAAFTLGRAVHLLEDMAQPQHAMDESHLHTWLLHLPLFWNDPSFIEEFMEANLTKDTPATAFCPNSQIDYETRIAEINSFASGVNWYQTMGYMQDLGVAVGREYWSRRYTAAMLQQAFGPGGTLQCDSARNCQPLVLTFQDGPSLQNVHCSAVSYYKGLDWDLDYRGQAIALRAGTAMKFAQGYEDRYGVGPFADEHVQLLLTPSVANAASLIVDFWLTVKDSCLTNSGREASQTCPMCLLGKPAGESPDDSLQVKGAGRHEAAETPASMDWHHICRVGLRKGLPTMADYGVAASLMDQLVALGPDADPGVAERRYVKYEALEQKYSGPSNRMPEEVEQAPDVAVWEKGFSWDARKLVESLDEPVKMLEDPREPILTDEEALSILPPPKGLLDADASKQPILILPTGSLYGFRRDSMEHLALRGFVENGGVVVCLSQPYGDDFSALPLPDNEELLAAGWKQDVSCFSDSAYPTCDHAILSGISADRVTAGIDGFFRAVPSNATVLLRRTVSGEPCLILYPVGQGFVVATTMYEDWASGNGQSTADGRSILAGIISWAKNPRQPIMRLDVPAQGGGAAHSLSLPVRNLSDQPADQVEVLVMTPDRQTVAARVTQGVQVPAGSQASVPVSVDLSGYLSQPGAPMGIFHADYRLMGMDPQSGQEEEIQPQGETDGGRVAVQRADASRLGLAQTAFSVWSDSDQAGNAQGNAHIHLEDHTGVARTFHLWASFDHYTGRLARAFDLPANGVTNFDVPQDFTREGTYRYFLMDPVFGTPVGQEGIYRGRWGNDPWLMAGSGALCLAGNLTGGKLDIFDPQGLSQTPYQPGASVSGTVYIGNLTNIGQDVPVVISLEAMDEVDSSTASARLPAFGTTPVSFTLSLPRSTSGYFVSAKLTVRGMNDRGATLKERSWTVPVQPFHPDLKVDTPWPGARPIASLADLSFSVTNRAGDSVAEAEGYAVKARLWTRDPGATQTVTLEQQEVLLPILAPGEASSGSIHWANWNPESGKEFGVCLEVAKQGGNLLQPGATQACRTALIAPVQYQDDSPAVAPGQPDLTFSGYLVNAGDLPRPVGLSWDLPAGALSHSEEVTVPPSARIPVSWTAPRPESLAAGSHPFSLTLTPRDLGGIVSAGGTLEIRAPALGFTWPSVPPAFRHDQPVHLVAALSATDLAGDLEGLLDAEMTWASGAVPLLQSEPVTLRTGAMTPIDLVLPLPQLQAPGPFSVKIAFTSRLGASRQEWSATYSLDGPRYSAALSDVQMPVGGLLTGSLSNDGAFEGAPLLAWSLTDSKRAVIDGGIYDLGAFPPGQTATFEGPYTSRLLPGSYVSAWTVSDPALAEPWRFSRPMAVVGALPVVTANAGKAVYTTTERPSVILTQDDPDHILPGSTYHLEVKRYLGAGGGALPGADYLGAPWETPCADATSNNRVAPSEWFWAPEAGAGGYWEDVRQEVRARPLPPFTAEFDGDGKADLVTVSRFGPLELNVYHGPDFQGRETLDILSTWGQTGDTWDQAFMAGAMGVHPDLVLGLRSTTDLTATVLRVGLDGTLRWRKDFPAPYSLTETIDSVRPLGPLFEDLDGDGSPDILFVYFDTLSALDGETGATLWTRHAGLPHVGHLASGPGLWAESTQEPFGLILLSLAGETIQQIPQDVAGLVTNLPLGDLDGDGYDETVTDGTEDSGHRIRALEPDGSILVQSDFVAGGWVLLEDVNGDGRAEALFDHRFTDDNDQARISIRAVDLMNGTLLWDTVLDPSPMGAYEESLGVLYRDSGNRPHLYYSVRNMGIVSLVASPVGPCSLLIDPSTGAIEETLGPGGDLNSYTAGDFDGDGVSEWYQGGFLLKQGCMDLAGTPGPCEDWETVWTYDGLPAGEEASAFPLHRTLPPGNYKVVATVTTEAGQTVLASPGAFTVTATGLGLAISPAPGAVLRPGEGFSGTVSIADLGAPPGPAASKRGRREASTFSVLLKLDGQEVTSWPVTLEAGYGLTLPFSLPPQAVGSHLLRLEAVGTEINASAAHSSFSVRDPLVTLTPQLPEAHDGGRFDFSVWVANVGEVPSHVVLEIADDQSNPQTFDLGPGQQAMAFFNRQALDDFSTTVTATGDLLASVPIFVPYGIRLALDAPDIGPQHTGPANLPVRIVQTGNLPYHGTLTARLTLPDGGNLVSSNPIQMEGASEQTLPLALALPQAGASRLHIELTASPAVLDRDLTAYSAGQGTIEATLPRRLGEGMASIPFTVTNGLETPGDFQVVLSRSAGQGETTIASTVVHAVGGVGVGGTLEGFIPRGTWTLKVALNGVESLTGEATVLPGVEGALDIKTSRDAQGLLHLGAEVSNTGFLPFDANLSVLTDRESAESIHLEPNDTVTRPLVLIADSVTTNALTVRGVLALPDGTQIERTLDVALLPADIVVTPPDSPLVLTPGQPWTAAFSIANRGDKSASISLVLEMPDSELGRSMEVAEIHGHAQIDLQALLSLPWDTPTGPSNVHYFIRDEKAQGDNLAEGDLPVLIQGATVSITASVDGVSFPVGASAAARVELALSPEGSPARDLAIRILSAHHEVVENLSLGGSRVLTFPVPISEDTDGVTVEVVQPGGRTLYINRFRVYPISNGFSIWPDKAAYDPGGTVTVTAVLPAPGALRLNFMEREVNLSGLGTVAQSFSIPADVAEDAYVISYEFTPEDAGAPGASGRLAVDIHGLRVTGGDSFLDKTVYSPGDSVKGQIVLVANQPLDGMLHLWIFYPDGSYADGGSQPVHLTPQLPARLPVAVPLSSGMAGTHRLAFSLSGATGVAYVGGSLPFRCGSGALLSLKPAQREYPGGGEPVQVSVATAGTGAGSLSVFVDGIEASQQAIQLNGVQTRIIALGALEAGDHALKASLLDSEGMISLARCRLVCGARLPDLTGAVSPLSREDRVQNLLVSVENRGRSTSAPCLASVYDGDPKVGGLLIESVGVAELSPGSTFAAAIPWDVAAMDGEHALHLVVDSAFQVQEWDETNNESHTAVDLYAAPVPPALFSPAEGSTTSVLRPTLTVYNGSAQRHLPLVYEFQVYSDARLDSLLVQSPHVHEGIEKTEWQLDRDLEAGQSYWWRARVTDTEEVSSPWMPAASFAVQSENRQPSVPVIVSPQDGATLWGLGAVLAWQRASDPDQGDLISYEVQVDEDPAFGSPDASQSGIPDGGSDFVSAELGALGGGGALVEGTSYNLRVRAVDGRGLPSGWSGGPRAFVFMRDEVPPSVGWLSPDEGDIIRTPQVVLSGIAGDDHSGVDRVEISFDEGLTWSLASGTGFWTYAFAPHQNGNILGAVRSIDRAGNSSPAVERGFTVALPNVPKGLQAIPDNTTALLYWQNPVLEGPRGFNLYLSESASGPYVQVNTQTLLHPCAVASGLTNGTPAYFAVSALYSEEESAMTPVAHAVPFASGRPPFVGDLWITRSGSDLVLDWTPLTEEHESDTHPCSGYDIYASEDPTVEPDAAGGANLLALDVLPPFRAAGLAEDSKSHYFTIVAKAGDVVGCWTESFLEQDDARLQRTPDWSDVMDDATSCGSYLSSRTPGGAVTLAYSGTAVSISTMKGPAQGLAQVRLDGVAMATVDLYAAIKTPQAWVYHLRGLPDGPHTLEWVVTGTKNPSSSGIEVTLDRLLVGR